MGPIIPPGPISLRGARTASGIPPGLGFLYEWPPVGKWLHLY